MVVLGEVDPDAAFGNLTIVGSAANLIVVQRSRHRVRIGFREYARAGIWVGTISIVLGVGWLPAGPW